MPQPQPKPAQWDIFISYAHEDDRNQEWVTKELYEPLKSCRASDGRALEIFFDKRTIPSGVSYTKYLAEAIRSSRHVIPVYSEAYFNSEMCNNELLHAVDMDPAGKRRTAMPILMEHTAAADIPVVAKLIQFIDCTERGWFDNLVRQLALKRSGLAYALRFEMSIADATVHQTLPEVRVVVENNGVRVVDEVETIQLFSDEGALQGTRTASTKNGRAVFADLFFSQPLEQTKLVATSPTCPAISSGPFAVRAAAPIVVDTAEPLIPLAGTPLFFRDSRALAVCTANSLEVYDSSARPLGSAPLGSGRIRLFKALGDAVFALSWEGRVHRATSGGAHQTWDLADDRGPCVPGDICALEGGGEAVGMWDGRVLQLRPDGAVDLWCRHAPGIAAMAASPQELLIADFEGMLAIYRDGRLVERHPLEKMVRTLHVHAGAVVAAGLQGLHQFVLRDRIMNRFPLRLDVMAALSGDKWSVAIGASGKGIFFDENLTIQRVFHVQAGAAPASMDARSTYTAMANPDGSYSLLAENRVILHHTAGPLAVAPSGERFAVGEAGGIRIISRSELLELTGSQHA